MGGKAGQVGTRKSLLQQRIDELEEASFVIKKDNDRLESEVFYLGETQAALGKKVDELLKINIVQCERLGHEDLLRSRIKELEAQVEKDESPEEAAP